MNPECRAGKHQNCDGQGWRDDLGNIGPCLCGCHEKVAMPVVTMTTEECVTWVCYEHNRHCDRIGTEHAEHACVFDTRSETDAFGRHGYLIASVDGKDPADLEPGDKIHITPVNFGIPRCPNCDMPLDSPHDFRCPNRVGL